MAYELQMPQLAQSVVEGELSRWLVAEGDVVEPEQLIAEITSDKVDVELPAPVGGGVLKILVPQGSTVRVGPPLAYIGERGETWNAKTAPSPATFSSLTSSILGIDEDKTAAATPAAMRTPQPKGPARASPAVR